MVKELLDFVTEKVTVRPVNITMVYTTILKMVAVAALAVTTAQDHGNFAQMEV